MLGHFFKKILPIVMVSSITMTGIVSGGASTQAASDTKKLKM